MCFLNFKLNILWLGSCEHFLNTRTYKFVRMALYEFSSSCVARNICHLSLWHTKRIKGYVSCAFSVSFKLTIFVVRLLQDITSHKVLVCIDEVLTDGCRMIYMHVYLFK